MVGKFWALLIALLVLLGAQAAVAEERTNNRWDIGVGVPYALAGVSLEQRLLGNLYLAYSIGSPYFLKKSSASSNYSLRYYHPVGEYGQNKIRFSIIDGDMAVYETREFKEYELAAGRGYFIGFVWQMGDGHHVNFDIGRTEYRDLDPYVDLEAPSFNVSFGYARSCNFFSALSW